MNQETKKPGKESQTGESESISSGISWIRGFQIFPVFLLS